MSEDGQEDGGRERVLSAIRRALGRGPLSPDARAELDGRLAAHPRNLLPADAIAEGPELIERFIARAEAAACTVARLAGDEAVPEAVADYLQSHNLPPRIRLPALAEVEDLPWDRAPLVERSAGPARDEDRVALTPALAGVAETGTVVLESGARRPSALNFLPEHHIVQLRTSDLAASHEEVWDRLREKAGGEKMGRETAGGKAAALPRTVNLITGPSRTGDIELTIHLGAHGPRALHILLIEDGR